MCNVGGGPLLIENGQAVGIKAMKVQTVVNISMLAMHIVYCIFILGLGIIEIPLYVDRDRYIQQKLVSNNFFMFL